MITKTLLKTITADSHPFARAELKCDFESMGYKEDEYFVYGTANVYDEDENRKPIKICNAAPYVNRVIVRRPQERTKFSGNVILEILNPTARMDIDRMWVNSWKFFTANGDIYIGITSKSDVLQSLYDFDIERYGELDWSNPLPNRKNPETEGVFGFDPRYEFGLFWDMLTDYAKLLRSSSDMNPLKDYGDFKLYLTGWSQSAGYVVRYVKSFAYLPEVDVNGPVFDGYLAAGGGCNPAPINTYSKVNKNFFGVDGAGVMGCREPYIAINTESENNIVNWHGDSDELGCLFRIYEIPGSSHDSKYNLLTYYHKDVDTEKINMIPQYNGIEGSPNDYPYEVIFNAAFYNLYNWVRNGIPAPHADRIPVNALGENKTDAFGNALGGIRTAAIDYPTATYYSYSMLPNGEKNWVFGHTKKFTSQFLKELYGSIENYRRLVTSHTYEQVAKGFIIKQDAENFIEALVQTAVDSGLC